MSQNKLLLIDGYGALYRAFYAIKSLSTKDGRPTNAVYGFVRMLNQMKEDWAPTHWAVIFDGGLPVERTEALPEYKAQRSPMPDDLRDQIPVIDEYLDAACIVNICIDGQEADDVLAAYACRAVKSSYEVMIGTSDKDLFQVVGEGIGIVPLSGKAGMMGPAEVEAKTGVTPDKMVDWLALVGDSSDNIPGVPGVGPKTAASLLNEHGSVQGILKNLDKVKREKIKVALEESCEILQRNLDLVRLNIDLDQERDLDDMKVSSPDPHRMLKLLEDLEFESMAKKFREPELFT